MTENLPSRGPSAIGWPGRLIDIDLVEQCRRGTVSTRSVAPKLSLWSD
jgi:hypothetical protein